MCGPGRKDPSPSPDRLVQRRVRRRRVDPPLGQAILSLELGPLRIQHLKEIRYTFPKPQPRQLGGVRILAPHSVDLMTHNQVGTLFDSTGARGFGFGFQTIERYGANGMASVGTFSWGGAYGSGYSVDPVEHLVIVFMINQLPNRSDIAGKFPTLVYQALVTSRR